MPPSDAGTTNGAILRLVWRHINRTISPSFSTMTKEPLAADGRRLFNHTSRAPRLGAGEG